MKKRSVIVIAIFVALVVASMAIVLGTGMLQPSIAEKTDSPVSSQALNKENSENSIEVESNIVESENTSNISEISKKNEPSIKESSNSGDASSKPSGSENNGSTSSSSPSSSSSSSSKPSGGSSSSSSSSKPSGNGGSSSSSSSSSNGGSGSSSSKPSGGNSSSSSSSSSSKPSHSHSYTSKTVKATCTSGGYTVHTCSCGASYTDGYTDAKGHKWSDWKTVKKATTSSEGKKQRTCSSCGKTESKTIAKIKDTSTSGGHKITGARKAVYSYRGMDSFSSVNLVDLINEERAKEGLGKLEWTADGLTRAVKEDPDAAEVYEDYFDSNGNFNPYIDPEVREPLEGAQKMADMGYATHGNGVGCSCVGSTKHDGDTIEQALRRHIQGYMNSPEHRAILMNAGSHRVTAAYAIGSDGTVYTAIRIGG